MTDKLFALVAISIFMMATLTVSAGEPVETVADTDISHLGVGDAETIYTESGKTIDLLRTEDGVEVYVDGELLGEPLEGLHEAHEAHETHETHDIEIESLHGDGHHEKIIVIREEIETN